MLQSKIDKIFKELHNVSGIAGDILVVGSDRNGTDHNVTQYQKCAEMKLKTNYG